MKNLYNFILNLFKKPKFHILESFVTGDKVFAPSITMNGDWSPYLSRPFENQFNGTFDELNCVCQSGINVIETILNYHLKNGTLPKELDKFLRDPRAGFLNAQGFVKLSTRFNSKMAGTTKVGLTMGAFWNSVNNDGIVPYKAYPDPVGKFIWEDYYKAVPAEVVKAGKLASSIFQWNWQVFIKYNWESPDLVGLETVLKSSPIHFSSYIGNTINGVEQVNNYDKGNYRHSRMIYDVDNCLEVLDSWTSSNNYLKVLVKEFPVATGIRASLKIGK